MPIWNEDDERSWEGRVVSVHESNNDLDHPATRWAMVWDGKGLKSVNFAWSGSGMQGFEGGRAEEDIFSGPFAQEYERYAMQQRERAEAERVARYKMERDQRLEEEHRRKQAAKADQYKKFLWAQKKLGQLLGEKNQDGVQRVLRWADYNVRERDLVSQLHRMVA